jgi:hypothetical protein
MSRIFDGQEVGSLRPKHFPAGFCRLDVLEWACEIPIQRRGFVRLPDDDRLPV